jgi:tetratricopeptide (TPR) repeat protein
MAPAPSKNPRLLFPVWAAILAAMLLAGIAYNLGLARYVANVRARDPGADLAAAARLIEQNDALGAFAHLAAAARKAPDSPELYRLRGDGYFHLKRWEEAFVAYQEAIRRGSRNESMRLKALNALLQLGRRQEAVDFGKRCLAEGFTYRTFPRYIAEAYRALGKHAESVPFYEAALKGYPNDLYLMEHLAQAYRLTGQGDKAEAMQRRIADTDTLLDRAGQ